MVGKEYSCSTEGDGPKFSPKIGTQVVVPWSSFPEASQPHWAAYAEHGVIGTYISQVNDEWLIRFDTLAAEWTRPRAWIKRLGSNTAIRSCRILDRPTYLRLHQNDDIVPTSKRKAPEGDKPYIGKKVWVPWSSFQESKDKIWRTYADHGVIGVYQKKIAIGWKVYFPALDSSWSLDAKWVKEFGADTALDKPVISADRYRLLSAQRKTSNTFMDKEDTPIQPTLAETPITLPLPLPLLDELQIPEVDPTLRHNFGAAILNVNTLHEDKLLVAHTLWSAGCGVTAFIDTRIKRSAQDRLRFKWKSLTGKEGILVFSDQHDNPGVGGQLHAITPHWRRRLRSTWSDPSNLGIILESTFDVAGGLVRFITVYWPVPYTHIDTESLSARLQAWLDVARPGTSWTTYITESIQARLRKPALFRVLGGDFNQRTNLLSEQVFSRGLHDAHPDAEFATFYRGSSPVNKIDFVLHDGPLLSAGFSTLEAWAQYTDHRPIWAMWSTNIPTPTLKVAAKCLRKLRIAKPGKDRDLFQERLSTISVQSGKPAEEQLHDLTLAVVRASKVTVPHRKIRLWTPTTAAILIRKTLLTDLSKLDPNSEERRAAITRSKQRTFDIGQDGSSLWDTLEEDPTLTATQFLVGADKTVIRANSIAVQKLLHVRRCRERLQSKALAFEQYQEDPHQFFKSLKKRNLRLDLSTIRMGDEVLTDPETIDSRLCQHFAESFGPKEAPSQLWNITEQFAVFDKATPATVPQPLKEKVWEAIRAPLESKRELVAAALTREKVMVTFDEFQAQVKLSSNQSAGGPTGLTYLMLKHVPVDLLQTMYELMSHCWVHSTLPSWWQDKLLYPLAKKSASGDVSNIRPIVLLEVLRKIWFKIIIRKIASAIEAADILQTNQHGFRSTRSTADNLIHLLNALEVTEQTGLYATSWDIVGAFNAPPREWLECGLRRLGVPDYLSKTLAYIDQGDTVRILTPHRIETGNGATFTTGSGVGQGDVVSPLVWICFFDIILTAVNRVPSNIHYADSQHFSHSVMDSAFADDLLSITSSLDSIQEKADIISACSALMKFHLATSKFRTFSTGAPGSVCIHDHQWNPLVIECALDGAFKYLGSTHDIDGTGTTETKLICAVVTSTLERIRPRVTSTRHGTTYLNLALLPKVLYPATFGWMNRTAQSQVSTHMATAYKIFSHLPASFPNAVLNAPLALGGMGFKHPGDHIAQAKYALINRLLKSPQRETRWAMGAILTRHQTITDSPTWKLTNGSGWMADLLPLLHDSETTLAYHHGFATNHLDAPLPKPSAQMLSLGITHVSDIYTRKLDRMVPPDPTTLGLQYGDLPTAPIELAVTYVRPGQVWGTSESPDEIFQVIGWKGNQCHVHVWRAIVTGQRGRQCFCRAELGVLPMQFTHKFLLSGTPARSEVLHTMCQVPSAPIRLYNNHTNVTSNGLIASDGTYENPDKLFGFFQPPVAFGAVVEIDNAPPHALRQAFRFPVPVTSQRAFTAEMVAQSLAVQLSAAPILTDCKSALFSLRSNRTLPGIFMATRPHAHRIDWTKSHPERRGKPHTWTPEDHAIFCADKVAGGQLPHCTLTYAEVGASCLKHSRLWALEDVNGPTLVTPLFRKQELLLSRYLATRTLNDQLLWSIEGLRFVCSLARTLAQRGALIKLYLHRFDVDRLARCGNTCSCGCFNSLETWLVSCQRADIQSERADFRARWQHIPAPTLLKSVISTIIRREPSTILFRGNWSSAHRERVHEAFYSGTHDAREWAKGIRSVTTALTGHALRLHQIVSSASTARPSRGRYRKGPQQHSTLEHYFNPPAVIHTPLICSSFPTLTPMACESIPSTSARSYSISTLSSSELLLPSNVMLDSLVSSHVTLENSHELLGNSVMLGNSISSNVMLVNSPVMLEHPICSHVMLANSSSSSPVMLDNPVSQIDCCSTSPAGKVRMRRRRVQSTLDRWFSRKPP